MRLTPGAESARRPDPLREVEEAARDPDADRPAGQTRRRRVARADQARETGTAGGTATARCSTTSRGSPRATASTSSSSAANSSAPSRTPSSGSKTIAYVRQTFKGKLTYSANWDHYSGIGFWDDLDLIGMNSYWKLGDNKDVSVDDDQEELAEVSRRGRRLRRARSTSR